MNIRLNNKDISLNRATFLLIFLFSMLIFVGRVNAEFICSAEVQYRWKKEAVASVPVEAGNGAKKPEPTKAPDSPPAEAPTESNNGEINVYWISLEQKGATEEEAKGKVNKLATLERGNAERACLAAHENLAGCISSKFSSMASTVGTLGFSARKAVEEAIASDCRLQQGNCLGSKIADMKCVEIILPTPTPDPAAAAKDKKKK